MTKYYLNILLLLITTLPLSINGQVSNECEQFTKAFEYVETSFLRKEFKKDRKLQIDTIVQQWSGIPFMSAEYHAYKMGITKSEFQKLDTTIRHKIFRKNEEYLINIDSIFSIDCFKFISYKRPNLKLNFTRISDKSISIWLSKIRRNRKKHSTGKYLIFIFDKKNQIEKVFETGWTE